MGPDYAVYATIAGMAAVTALTRFSGYWMIRYFQIKGRLAAGLEAMPAAVLTALVTPAALATGIPETLSVILTILLALRFHMLLAVGSGVASVVLLRYLFVHYGWSG